MAVNGTNFTYPDTARREDLLDVLTNIDPVEDRLFKLFQKTTAYNTLHEWPVDSLETPGDNAQPEAGQAPLDNAADPSRRQNVTQIFAKTATVSNTELAVGHAGFENRMSYEIMKKMKALSNDIELALVRGSIASGLATVGSANGRRLRGIKNWIATNASNYSGASLTETVFNDMLEASWNRGGNVNTVVGPMKAKRRVSSFTAGSTKEIPADSNTLINSINVYESDAAGTVKLYAHRMVTRAGDYGTTATPGFDVLALQDDTWAVALLRNPDTIDLAVTGDYQSKEIVTELTLEARAEQANVYGQLFF